MLKKVFTDISNCCDIYRTYFIFHMANSLNNIMVMDMGNAFLLFNIYTFHAMILFRFLNEQIQNSNSSC